MALPGQWCASSTVTSSSLCSPPTVRNSLCSPRLSAVTNSWFISGYLARSQRLVTTVHNTTGLVATSLRHELLSPCKWSVCVHVAQEQVV
jgi:hypothetical protein